MKETTKFRLRIPAMAALLVALAWPSATRALTLEEAIGVALERSPDLRAAAQHLLAAGARADQARVRPNPELEGEIEHAGGSSAFSGSDAAEYTLLVSQPIQLGGKRSKGARVATLDHSLAEWTYASRKRDLASAVTSVFVQLLEDREQVRISEELVKLSGELVRTAERRVKSGGASVLEQTKAEIEHATSIAAQKQMRQRLASSRTRLATLLGMDADELGDISGDLYALHDPPAFSDLERRLEDNPEWARWSDEMAHREAAVALADAGRAPDMSLGVGWKRIEEANDGEGDDVLVLAAGLPLPLFDRNQGARSAARHAQAAASEERRAAELALKQELADAYGELIQAHSQADAIKHHILPAASKAFDVSREGYLQGRFGYLDLLDAERTLFETKGRYVETLRMYHQAAADIERLTGNSY